MFKFLKKKENFGNVAKGKVIDLSDVPDPVFSQKLLGDGYGLEIQEGSVYAPLSGTLSLVFPTGHAFGIIDSNGVEVLIHVGIDTVELNGEGFKVHVEQGQAVHKGDKLVDVDLAFVEASGKSITSAIIFTSGEKVTILKPNTVCEALEENIIDY